MKISNRQLAELIGIISVVASLIFVGLQLMLDRQVAIAAQFHNRSELGHNDLVSRFENEPYIRMQAQQLENGFEPTWWNPEIEKYRSERKLTLEDIVRLELLLRNEFLRYNNNYYQYSRGLIDRENYLNGLRNYFLQRMGQDPLFRAVALSPGPMEPGLIQLIQEVEEELNGTN